MKTYSVEAAFITKATIALLECKVRARISKEREPFTMEKILGKHWEAEYAPFHSTFAHRGAKQRETASQQMGRLLKKVCKKLGMYVRSVDDGKGHKHLEYYLPDPQ